MHDQVPAPAPRTTLRHAWILAALACVGWLLAGPLQAQTVYKCTGAGDQLIFQGTPCRHGLKQKVLHLHVQQPSAPVPGPSLSDSAPPPPTPTPAPPTVAATPAASARTYQIPQLYRCVHATNGKTYISRNGHPRPYRVPMGILGEFQAPLDKAYGGKGATRRAASDPTLAHGRITQGLVAGNYTLVQDRCEPMNVPDICDTLGQRLDTLESAIDKAFQSDKPPLEKKAAKLRSEMAGCRR